MTAVSKLDTGSDEKSTKNPFMISSQYLKSGRNANTNRIRKSEIKVYESKIHSSFVSGDMISSSQSYLVPQQRSNSNDKACFKPAKTQRIKVTVN